MGVAVDPESVKVFVDALECELITPCGALVESAVDRQAALSGRGWRFRDVPIPSPVTTIADPVVGVNLHPF